MIFDGWEPILRTLVLGTLAYAAVVVLLRVSGKRTLSKMNAFDFVITVALGSTLATVLTSKDVALAQGVVALGLLIALQLVNTFVAVRVPRFQNLLKAEPTLLFFQGDYLDHALKAERVTPDEILAAVRQQGLTPEEVGAVILETEGSLSVLPGAQSAEALARAGVRAPSRGPGAS